jgi:hypothetical protein
MKTGNWRQRAWAIVLLILLAIAFGGQIVIGAPLLTIVPTGMMVFAWTALLIISLRKSTS